MRGAHRGRSPRGRPRQTSCASCGWQSSSIPSAASGCCLPALALAHAMLELAGRLLLQLRQRSVLAAVPAHHHHQPPQALAMLPARARAPSTIACLLTLACCLLPGGALLGAAPPACRQEAMDPDRVATCLDSIISHCKDLTRTGCFGGWSSKLEEVGAGAAAPPGALGSRAALVSGATATPQLPAHSRAPPALPRPSAHAVPLSPPLFAPTSAAPPAVRGRAASGCVG